jgi:CheY-like chemotaxis protein
MDDATRKRLFEPFFTTKPKGKGTGLGLSTVQSIMRDNGGHVEVETELGRGSTFRVYLPLLRQAVPEAPPPRAAAQRVTGTETVLVVEDDATVRDMVARILREAGYSVLTAPNGREALQTSEQYGGDIQLLLTDVVMPQMGGRQLAERLHESRPGLQVLFMSGYMEEAFGHPGPRQLGDRWIRKPLREPDLVQRVREVLDAID